MKTTYRLVVAEKPSVAASIAVVLGAKERKDGYITGSGWIVTWCVGHLVELAHADVYDERFARWNYVDLPILPDIWRFTVSEGKKKQLDVLRNLMHSKDAESIICATDAGREGELIFRLVYDYCGCKKPVNRLWISSMEDSAIRDGFVKLRPGSDYDNLYRAALCRSQADWIVGINATRLFSVLYGVTLNCGRVQTPTLAMVVRREQEISAFEAMPFYTPEIDCGAFTASGERVYDAAAAEAVRAACDGKAAVVRSVEREKKTAAPPRLYDLTTLQREANRLFGFTAQQTLDYAQSLYERKLITYPRTDSRFLTNGMAAGLPALVKFVADALPFSKGLVFLVNTAQVTDDSKVTDHHAIIPTAELAKSNLSALPSGERDVLLMIAARLLCAVGEKHSFETVTAVLECAGQSFTAKGRTVLCEGWKEAEQAFRAAVKHKPDEDAGEDDDTKALPELSKGQAFSPVKAFVRKGRTAAPPRYTEDSLLAAMEAAGNEDMPEMAERRGLGTPATRAGVIERLIKSGYIERKKRLIFPTDKGVNLITVLPETVKSPKLTADWEHALGKIERGELDGKVFMTDIAAMTLGLVKTHPAPDKEHAALFTPAGTTGSAAPGNVIGLCPRCGFSILEKPKGFLCSNRACSFTLWKDNRFFSAKRKQLNKETAAALLDKGRVFMHGLYSERTGKTYDAAIVMEAGSLPEDAGKPVRFRLEFAKDGGNNGTCPE